MMLLYQKIEQMKSLITLTTAVAIWLLLGCYAQAQKNYDWTKAEVEELTTLKEQIVVEEKEALKRDVEDINARLQNNAITDTEAEILKQNASPKDIRRDVKIIIPKGLDVFGKKPLK